MLTVIIPVYKVEKTLQRCVESVTQQTYGSLDILLVDDGSPDKCPLLCEQWAKRDNRIRVIHKSNGGLSSARNAALDMAKGDFVTFVDSDDYIDKDTYDKVIQAFTADVDIVEYPVWRFYGSQKQSKLTFKETIYNSANDYWLKGKAYEHSYAWNKIYRRKLFEDIRFPVGKLFEDIHTLPLILHKAKAVKTVGCGLYYYCYNPNGIINTSGGDGLRQLLSGHLSNFAPICNEEYYLNVLNIQLDVCRMTGDKPTLNSLRIKHPWRQGLKNGLKLSLLNIIGLKNLCAIYTYLYIIKKGKQ